MRISILKGDPGYKENAVAYRVMFNGQERTDCFTADEELGEIHCYDQMIKNGRQFRKVDPGTGKPITIILRGEVVIVGPGLVHSAKSGMSGTRTGRGNDQPRDET